MSLNLISTKKLECYSIKFSKGFDSLRAEAVEI